MNKTHWRTGEEFQDDITHMDNHISLDQTGYWFWDETQAWAFGPFLTQEETKLALNKYLKSLSTIDEGVLTIRREENDGI
jgi:hypothetical protein